MLAIHFVETIEAKTDQLAGGANVDSVLKLTIKTSASTADTLRLNLYSLDEKNVVRFARLAQAINEIFAGGEAPAMAQSYPYRAIYRAGCGESWTCTVNSPASADVFPYHSHVTFDWDNEKLEQVVPNDRLSTLTTSE
jgi:hypothetical protein